MKVSLNPRGPSRKAKYSLATDSEPCSASERWEEPRQGEDSEPETTCLQAVRARLRSYQQSAFSNEQEGKANVLNELIAESLLLIAPEG